MTHPELPHNIEAEKATLGSILLNREAIVAVAPWLQGEYFYMERHAQIYEAMLTCYNARIPPDVRTVSDDLRRRDRLEAVGGISYLSDLVDTVPTSYHVEYYARIVERTALLRQLINAGGKIAALGYDEQQELEDTLDKAEQTLFEVSQRRSTQDFVPIGQVIDTYYEQINYLQEHRGEVVGVPSGFRDLDEITGGLQASDLIILAARPSVGKCLAAWTLIDDPVTGARVTIEECVRRQLPTVYGIDVFGMLRPTLVSAWIDSGLKPCYRVRTHSGRTIDATANHPFLTAKGWIPLGDLSAGCSIAVPKAVPAFGNDESWPIELVRLLAYFIAEGSLTATSPGFTNTDSVIIDDFKAIIAAHFPQCAIRQHSITYYASRPGRVLGCLPAAGRRRPSRVRSIWAGRKVLSNEGRSLARRDDRPRVGDALPAGDWLDRREERPVCGACAHAAPALEQYRAPAARDLGSGARRDPVAGLVIGRAGAQERRDDKDRQVCRVQSPHTPQPPACAAGEIRRGSG